MEPNWRKADYISALEEVEMLMGAAPGTVEGERLDVLSMQIEAYERRHFPMDLPDSGAS
jgi:HTH-type transcriptional regulator/antitoxin HigA